MIKVLYPCDPSKNTECAKTACQTQCTMTAKKEFAKDGWKYSDLKIQPSRHMDLRDIIFLNILKQEAEEHDNKL